MRQQLLAFFALAAPAVALLELLQPQAKPDARFGNLPHADLQRAAGPEMGAGRPLAPQTPQEPAMASAGRPMAAGNPANPANPASPATNLQGALRMSMGSLMGFCRCEGTFPRASNFSARARMLRILSRPARA